MNALERPPVAPGLSAGRPTPKEPRLPPLREDLRLHEGPDADDGSPTWVLEDPARDQFFQLGVLQAECLKRWHLGTAKAVAAAVGRETLLRPTAETVENFAKFLMRMSLTREAGTSARLAEQMKRKPKQTLWKFFLHHYLFFRIPLVAPDAFLRRTLPWVERLFFTKTFLWATLTALVLALYLIGRQWDAFTHTFSHFFSWEGAVMAGLTIACTKVIHELAHAYTAEHFGCRIPHMGIAFMVMMPLLYTDTSAAWRLKSKRQRMTVCAAGVLGELALGVWAALAWSFLPEGGLKSAAFMLATTTWIMTLAINSSPFMRFDGYYLLSDWLGVANLHQRSFALAKWRMRELLFGFGEKKPESFEPWKERALIIYAWATWLYRFFLFCGIALLVYHAFFKLLGIFLFCVEVSVFVMLPILRELKEWALRILKGKAATRSLWLLLPIAGILAVFFMPWRSEVAAPAVVKPAAAVTLYTPAAAQVEAIEAAQGDAVKKGQVLFRLRSPELAHELEKLESDRASLRWRAEYMRMNREGAADVPAALRELSALERRIAELKKRTALLEVRSPVDGRVADRMEPLAVGEWLPDGQALAVVAAAAGTDRPALEIVGYVSEQDLNRFAAGASAKIIPEDALQPAIPASVEAVDGTAARHLGAVPELASHFGGAVASLPAPAEVAKSLGVDQGQVFAPKEAIYRVTAAPAGAQQGTAASDLQVRRGTLLIEGERESLAGRFARAAWSVLLRESNF